MVREPSLLILKRYSIVSNENGLCILGCSEHIQIVNAASAIKIPSPTTFKLRLIILFKINNATIPDTLFNEEVIGKLLENRNLYDVRLLIRVFLILRVEHFDVAHIYTLYYF